MRIEIIGQSAHLTPATPNEAQILMALGAYSPAPRVTYGKIPLTLKALTNVHQYFPYLGLEDRIFDTSLALSINKASLNYEPTPEFRPYQLQGINWIKTRIDETKGLGLLWDPRTGKTRTTCKATESYKKVIVLSLAGQEENWTSTYKQISNRESFNIHKKSPTQRQQIYEDFIMAEEGILVGSVNTVTADVFKYESLFALLTIDMLVIDEIHKIKNVKTALHKGAKKLRTMTERVIGLTGTPVSKNVAELIPIITFLLPSFSKTYLQKYFFNVETSRFNKFGTPTSIRGDRREEWLEFMGLYFSQVKQEQALPWATEPEQITILLDMEKEQRKTYEDMLYYMEGKFFNKEGKHVGTHQLQEAIEQIMRWRQISLAPWIYHQKDTPEHHVKGKSAKEEWLMEYIKTQEYEGLIVFSCFTSYLKQLKEKLEKQNYKVGMITGSTTNKITIQDNFQRGEYDILLLNIQSGSKGLTLDRSDTMIFLDEDWRPDELEQARRRFDPTNPDRVKKLSQIYTLQIKDKFTVGEEIIESIDKYINDVIKNKISQTEIINKFKAIWNELKGKED